MAYDCNDLLIYLYHICIMAKTTFYSSTNIYATGSLSHGFFSGNVGVKIKFVVFHFHVVLCSIEIVKKKKIDIWCSNNVTLTEISITHLSKSLRNSLYIKTWAGRISIQVMRGCFRKKRPEGLLWPAAEQETGNDGYSHSEIMSLDSILHFGGHA